MDDLDISSGNKNWKQEAEILRAKAEAIRSEARAMEVELLANKQKLRLAKISESDDVIDSLFPPTMFPPPPPLAIASKLKTEGWSSDVIYMVVDRMFERQMIAVGQKVPDDKPLDFSVGARADKIVQVDGAEFDRLQDALNILQEASAILDNQVQKEEQEEQLESNTATRKRRGWDGRLESGIIARRNELERVQRETRNRKFAAEINSIVQTNRSIAAYIRQTAFNISSTPQQGSPQNDTQIPLAPMWVPSSFLPYIISSGKSTLGPEQVKLLETRVLQGSRFFVTSTDSIPGAAIFRGNLRSSATTNDTKVFLDELQERLENEGLGDAVQLFFLPDPEWRFKQDEVKQGPKPVLLALSKSVSPDMSKTTTTNSSSSMQSSNVKVIATIAKVSTYGRYIDWIFFTVSQHHSHTFFVCLANSPLPMRWHCLLPLPIPFLLTRWIHPFSRPLSMMEI